MVAKQPPDLDLVGNIRAIKAEIARLQGLLDEAGAELLGKSAATPAAVKRAAAAANKIKREGVSRHGQPSELVEGSAASWAAAAIRDAGRPLHMRDLVKAIEGQGHKVKPTTLMGSLFRWVKKRSVFYRAGKNTFGLIEMRKG